ncbi:hydrolase [Pandoraea terrae]|uniref:Hydrolase n=2 Tax=Pandoraea terrae TaxID=1537710 RepID=A0A5E4U3Q5_9BURK|nr:hydrolase [Pandoraea terrae]
MNPQPTTVAASSVSAPRPRAVSAADLRQPLQGTVHVLERPDGTQLHVVVDGNGPQSVLLEHGFSMSADVWSLVQRELVARGLRVIAYDRRAHGRSTCGRDGLTSAALRADLKAVAETFDVNQAVLVCHSMGNFVALGALEDATFRSRFRYGVLVNPVTGHSAKGSPVVLFQAPLLALGVVQCLVRIPSVGRKFARMNLGGAASDAVVEATRLTLAEVSTKFSPVLKMLRRESVESVLARIDLPLHVFTSNEDRTTPAWHAELIVARAPRAKIDYVAGAGHMLPWEAPDEIVQAVLAGLPA